ncbi:hypothetical protein CTI14_13030 [Methylobacterium radiotolerans]|nr:hypothetical protein CTI14_13030 [Methylobacterium radiotolerans]
MPRIGYDKRGPAMMAISAIDMALHDIAARAQGVNIAQQLGGAVRHEVPCYASAFHRRGRCAVSALSARDRSASAPGFQSSQTPSRDLTSGGRRHGATGPRVDRAGCRLHARHQPGLQHGRLRDWRHGLSSRRAPLWIEEPVGPENLEGYAATAQAAACAIAGGEAIGSLAGFDGLLRTGAIGVLQPDLGVCGGFTGYRKAAALAESRDVAVMPHAFGTAINFLASLQVAATQMPARGGAWSNYPFVEYDVTGNPLIALTGHPIQGNGLSSPTRRPRPGHGLHAGTVRTLDGPALAHRNLGRPPCRDTSKPNQETTCAAKIPIDHAPRGAAFPPCSWHWPCQAWVPRQPMPLSHGLPNPSP